MKNTTFFVFLLLSFASLAQTKVSSIVKEVTIYNSGAQVTREVTVDLKKDENNFVIKGISPEIDINSIRIKTFDEKALVTGFNHQSSVFSDEESNDKIIEIGKKSENITSQKRKLEIEKTLLERQEKLLLENQKVGGASVGMKSEDLIKTFDYFETKMKKILNQQYQIKTSIDSLDKVIKEYNKEINAIQQAGENKFSEIVFTIKSENYLPKSKVIISYFVKNAGWLPNYDFIATELNKPLKVVYKSKIYQYSGEDWKDVKLTLSNSLPQKNSTAPEILPWYWGQPNDYSTYFENLVTVAKDGEVWGKVKDKEGVGIPGVTISLKGTSFGVATDQNGNFRMAIPPDRIGKTNELIFSFIGFISESRIAGNNPINVILKEDSQHLDEVVVVGYAPQKRNNAVAAVSVFSGKAAGLSVKSEEITTLIEEKEKPISVDFTFQEKVTLLSDGKDKTLDMKELSIPVDYQYVSVPKVDEAVFLKANILDYEKFNFIEGEVNLYFEGTFVGKTKLLNQNSDTLSISMGRDPSLKIERKQVKTFSKKQTFGSNRQDDFTYEITLKNSKNQEVKVLVIDQFPISGNKEIDVLAKKLSEGGFDEKDGKIKFDLLLKPLTDKKLTFSYSVKYPKGFVVKNEE
jgi:hypothetical protein